MISKKNLIKSLRNYVSEHELALGLCCFAGLCIGAIILVVLIEISEIVLIAWVVLWLLIWLFYSFYKAYFTGIGEGYQMADKPQQKTIEIRDTWPSHIYHASKTTLLLLLMILFFPWFIMYRLGKWKGRKRWWALDKKPKEEDAERVRLSERKKYTNEYYDNPNDHPPNAYGYCGTEREDEELMNAIRNWPEDGVKDEKTNDPLIEAQKKGLKNLLTKRLTRAERLIIVLYYYDEMTIKEIAKVLDLSEACVSQMHSTIIARLKSDM